ncbi:putative non-specific lipid-transfer protein type 2 [Helianthus annuus]|nr:putative non-specific lipid-transfer protein type 2 [Helianthus annuus]
MSYASWIPMMIVMTVLMVQVNVGMAQGCKLPFQLAPCLSFITSNIAPAADSQCCNVLHDQTSCLCSFVKNPVYAWILHLPGATTVANACSITIPDPSTCT